MSPLPTGLQSAGPAGVTGWAISSRVEGSQSDQVRCVAGQVGEVHTGVRDKNHFDLLSLVLLVPLPVVDLQHRKKHGQQHWLCFSPNNFQSSRFLLCLT